MASVLERIGSEAAISDGIPSNSDGSVSDDVGGGSDGGYSDDDFDHDDGAGDAELMEAAAIIARAKSRTQGVLHCLLPLYEILGGFTPCKGVNTARDGRSYAQGVRRQLNSFCGFPRVVCVCRIPVVAASVAQDAVTSG